MSAKRHWWARPFRYLEGFILPSAPQSAARLLSLAFGGVACYVAVKHPDATGTIVGLASTAVGVYATRTVGQNGDARPFWAKLPQQQTVERAEKVVQAVAQRVEGATATATATAPPPANGH